LVPYKRVDLAIEACRQAKVPLRIVGQGPELPKLIGLAGSGVEFLGERTNDEIRELYRHATAVLLPGEEDFGIVPVEAQACGRPVIGLARGGTAETILHEQTGLLLDDMSPEKLAAAVTRIQAMRFDPDFVRSHALQFSEERFAREIRSEVDRLMTAPDEAARC
jgi:glycosyltransferase involved in cell wall biosynthesis